MSSPKFSSICPTQPSVLPFASATDSTLHRPAWRSTRVIDPSPWSPRRPPSRFKGHLRYDLLGPPTSELPADLPRTPAVTTAEIPPSDTPETNAGATESSTIEPGKAVKPPGNENAAPDTAAANNADAAKGEGTISPRTDLTNLEELRWFQHRWLDKHGRDSHLKATREQLALMRRWFDSLDTDGSGEVGLDELEDPLVSVGLACSRDDVQHLIEEVDLNGTGGVTFDAFLNLLYPERAKRERSRRFPPPLHTPKHRPPARPDGSAKVLGRPGVSPKARQHPGKSSVANPVARLFEDLQAGKLGDMAVPFPMLITAYRRRMLLNAHMADNPTAKRVGSSVLQALEASRQDSSTTDTYDWRRTHFDLQLPSILP
ncbi:EF hand protein [Phytophthora cinnamomi]|uniref:EF hand protein n=1 Tax=Phytophthora cinnamomi TaxID=4785 RepID=UPI00355A21E6|nr:EF hand protein [Phytophthora cinnamomi]